jgi:hypothetical protein
MLAVGQMLCPTCGVPMIDVAAKTTLLIRQSTSPAVAASQTPNVIHRLVAAILFAWGSFFGLQLIWEAGLSPDASGHHFGPMITPMFLSLAVYLTAVLAGLLVGAGNSRSWAAGALVGMAHMAAVTAWYLFAIGRSALPALVIAWPIVPAMAALGGRLGRFLFPHWTDVSQYVPAVAAERPKAKRRKPTEPLTIAWLRILSGATLAVGGTLWADRLREYILGTSGGLFTVDSRIQIHFVTWVIASLTVFAGGIVAGASTRLGLRHGLLMGITSCVAIFTMQGLVVREALPAERFFGAVVGLPEDGADQPARLLLFLSTNSLLLSVVGGWIGSMLLPPTAAPRRLDRGAV